MSLLLRLMAARRREPMVKRTRTALTRTATSALFLSDTPAGEGGAERPDLTEADALAVLDCRHNFGLECVEHGEDVGFGDGAAVGDVLCDAFESYGHGGCCLDVVLDGFVNGVFLTLNDYGNHSCVSVLGV